MDRITCTFKIYLMFNIILLFTGKNVDSLECQNYSKNPLYGKAQNVICNVTVFMSVTLMFVMYINYFEVAIEFVNRRHQKTHSHGLKRLQMNSEDNRNFIKT